MKNDKMSLKTFFFNILNGMATGIVISLIPNAMLGELFKYLAAYHPIFIALGQLLLMFQFSASMIIGILVGHQFKLSGPQSAILGGAAFIGSGAVKFDDAGAHLVGMGDLINMLITIAMAVGIIRVIGNKLGTLSLVFLPILAGVIPGFIGTLTLPLSKLVTGSIGRVIDNFTTLNPLAMAILICMSFSLLMATPISLVAIATVISLSGLGSGAANLGIAACCYTFIAGSLFVNNKGVNTTLIIGAAKMMMPVYVKHPLLMLPLAINGAIGGLMAYLVGVQGTPMSAGFGYTGLVGPINSLNLMDGDMMSNIIGLLFAYIIVPIPAAFLVHYLLKKLIPSYGNHLYKFNTKEG